MDRSNSLRSLHMARENVIFVEFLTDCSALIAEDSKSEWQT